MYPAAASRSNLPAGAHPGGLHTQTARFVGSSGPDRVLRGEVSNFSQAQSGVSCTSRKFIFHKEQINRVL